MRARLIDIVDHDSCCKVRIVRAIAAVELKIPQRRFGRTGEMQYWSRPCAGPLERGVPIPHQLYVSICRDRYGRSDVVDALRDVHDGTIAVLRGSTVDHLLNGRSVSTDGHFEDWAVEVGLNAGEYWFGRTDRTRTYDGGVNLCNSAEGSKGWIPAQSWFWIAFGTVKVLPSATTLRPSTIGPLVTEARDFIVLS